MFSYCGNNPVNNSDPSGEFFIAALIVGGIVGAIGGLTYGGIRLCEKLFNIPPYKEQSDFQKVSTAYLTGISLNNMYFSMNYTQTFADVTKNAAQQDLITKSSSTSSGSKTMTPVIGKMKDLEKAKISKNEFKVADLLPDKGNPKANWHQNSSVLRTFMDGRKIRDVSPYPMSNAGFLGAERNLLQNHGYVYSQGFWIKWDK